MNISFFILQSTKQNFSYKEKGGGGGQFKEENFVKIA